MNPSPRSSKASPADASDIWRRGEPIGVLAVLLRAGADRIDETCPAMRAHARTMRTAADELVALHAEKTGAFQALERSQALLGDPDE
jgi:hypothetical protein